MQGKCVSKNQTQNNYDFEQLSQTVELTDIDNTNVVSAQSPEVQLASGDPFPDITPTSFLSRPVKIGTHVMTRDTRISFAPEQLLKNNPTIQNIFPIFIILKLMCL